MCERPEEQVGHRVLFSGRVQGVGFRFTTCDVAKAFAVTGYVKNLLDGRVELVCEGSREETVKFIDAVYSAMHNCVGEMQSSEVSWTGEYRDFGVQV